MFVAVGETVGVGLGGLVGVAGGTGTSETVMDPSLPVAARSSCPLGSNALTVRLLKKYVDGNADEAMRNVQS